MILIAHCNVQSVKNLFSDFNRFSTIVGFNALKKQINTQGTNWYLVIINVFWHDCYATKTRVRVQGSPCKIETHITPRKHSKHKIFEILYCRKFEIGHVLNILLITSSFIISIIEITKELNSCLNDFIPLVLQKSHNLFFILSWNKNQVFSNVFEFA